MTSKRKLKDNPKYNKVYIENDMSSELRRCNANMRTILKELKA